MTPLAARMFRWGDEATKRALAGSQFFECSALTPLAIEMRLSDDQESGFSSNARLPAPRSIIEAMIGSRRMAFACQDREADGRVAVNCFVEGQERHADMHWQAAFTPGTDQITFNQTTLPSEKMQEEIFIGLVLVEKFLCIINQPGLVDLRARATDKRVMREAEARNIDRPSPKWHQCHIRPGVHGTKGEEQGAHRSHQLHYVRKHKKPSLGPDRWIDGYWRGDADLGVHLKSYVAHPN